MGSKLLFVFGIVLAHGALAAGLMAQETPRHRAAVISSCTEIPSRPLDFAPRREMLAYVATPSNSESGALLP
jgi:hypothetical protein